MSKSVFVVTAGRYRSFGTWDERRKHQTYMSPMFDTFEEAYTDYARIEPVYYADWIEIEFYNDRDSTQNIKPVIIKIEDYEY
jgi:hypothetical protein